MEVGVRWRWRWWSRWRWQWQWQWQPLTCGVQNSMVRSPSSAAHFFRSSSNDASASFIASSPASWASSVPGLGTTRPSFCAFAQSNAFRKCSSSSDRSGKPSPLVSIDASPGAASATAATCGATLSTAAASPSKPSSALMNSLSRA